MAEALFFEPMVGGEDDDEVDGDFQSMAARPAPVTTKQKQKQQPMFGLGAAKTPIPTGGSGSSGGVILTNTKNSAKTVKAAATTTATKRSSAAAAEQQRTALVPVPQVYKPVGAAEVPLLSFLASIGA